jgi:hypothetical protein
MIHIFLFSVVMLAALGVGVLGATIEKESKVAGRLYVGMSVPGVMMIITGGQLWSDLLDALGG